MLEIVFHWVSVVVLSEMAKLESKSFFIKEEISCVPLSSLLRGLQEGFMKKCVLSYCISIFKVPKQSCRDHFHVCTYIHTFQ